LGRKVQLQIGATSEVAGETVLLAAPSPHMYPKVSENSLITAALTRHVLADGPRRPDGLDQAPLGDDVPCSF
jgi:hypothetical protein